MIQTLLKRLSSDKKKVFIVLIVLVGIRKFFLSYRKFLQQASIIRRIQQQKIRYFQARQKMITKFMRDYSGKIDAQQFQLIINSKVYKLRQLLDSQIITSEEATICYLIRAIQKAVPRNYVADLNILIAIKQAKTRDLQLTEMKAQNQKPPFFHGIPISIKDNLPALGYRFSHGMASKLNNVCTKDCSYVRCLRQEGAVFLYGTTMPQFGMDIHTDSPLWGVAENAWNPLFSVGGSSGGSAGCIAVKACPISIGTDIGGSIRIPADWNGLYGFQPSNSRVSKRGTVVGSRTGDINNKREVSVGVGPIGRCTRDLVMMCQATLGKFYDDPLRNGNQFNDTIFKEFGTGQKKLRIGVIFDDSQFPCVPPNKNVVREVAEKLKSMGHQIINFQAENQIHQLELLCHEVIYQLNHTEFLEKAILGDEMSATTQASHRNNRTDLINTIRKLYEEFKFRWNGEERISKLFFHQQYHYQFSKVYEKIDNLGYRFFDQWNQNQIDALITPNNPFFIPQLNGDNLLAMPNFYLVTSMLNMPGGCLPIRFSREEQEFKNEKEANEYINKWSSKLLGKRAAKTNFNSQNMPIGVHIVTLPNKDEECLKLMEILEREYQFYDLPQV